MSLDAPVVIEPKISSSAARPPVSVAILFSSSSLRHEVMLALVHLHGVAERARGARHDGDLGDGRRVGLLGRDQRVADLVIGDDLLLLVR